MNPSAMNGTGSACRAPSGEKQHVSVRAGNLLLGIGIERIQEINRPSKLTIVPKSPSFVRGVMNLRGEVVTVVDLNSILKNRKTELTETSRIIILENDGEKTGLLADGVGEVITFGPERIDPVPCHLEEEDAGFFEGVVQLEERLLVLLDVDAVLGIEEIEAGS